MKEITKDMIMLKTKIKSDIWNIHLDCPCCDNWEQLGVDDPRKMLNAIPIIEWYPDVIDRNEISIHKCTQCKTEFEVEWDYKNKGIDSFIESEVERGYDTDSTEGRGAYRDGEPAYEQTSEVK